MRDSYGRECLSSLGQRAAQFPDQVDLQDRLLTCRAVHRLVWWNERLVFGDNGVDHQVEVQRQ